MRRALYFKVALVLSLAADLLSLATSNGGNPMALGELFKYLVTWLFGLCWLVGTPAALVDDRTRSEDSEMGQAPGLSTPAPAPS